MNVFFSPQNDTMSRSGTVRAEIYATLLFLDNEHQNRYYAEVAECLGATSQLEKPFPPFDLDAGDVLLTLNGIDIRNTPSMAIKELIESFPNNSQKPPTDKEVKLLTFSYVQAKDKLDRHITDKLVSIKQIGLGPAYITNYCFLTIGSCYY